MFIAYKIITCLIFSPAILITILVLLAILVPKYNRKVGVARMLLIILSFCIYLSSIDISVMMAADIIEKKWAAVRDSDLRDIDAIVVLGGGLKSAGPTGPEGRTGMLPGPSAMNRLYEGMRLYKRLQIKYPGKKIPLIFSGGIVFPHHPSEASVAWNIFRGLDFPAEDFIMDERSRTTMENAANVRQICRERGFHKILLVTSAWHMTRAMMSFENSRLDIVPAPTDYLGNYGSISLDDFIPDAGSMHNFQKLIHEYPGIIFYRIRLAVDANPCYKEER